jgi:hypothetical protein
VLLEKNDEYEEYLRDVQTEVYAKLNKHMLTIFCSQTAFIVFDLD